MTASLHNFASKALEANRIRFADLRRLQRDVLPLRITTRDEAEVLLALDGTVERADRDWTEYVVPAVVQFVIWGLEPVGRIDQEKADWLAAAVAKGRRRSAATIIREVVREAPLIDEGCRVSWRTSPGHKPSKSLSAVEYRLMTEATDVSSDMPLHHRTDGSPAILP
jgi:hypothetical protein